MRTSYTSEFVESVADLPIELKKSYSLIKDLDEYVHEMMDGRPSAETPGVEEMKQQMLNKARRINESGKGTMDKAGLGIIKKQWEALQVLCSKTAREGSPCQWVLHWVSGMYRPRRRRSWK